MPTIKEILSGFPKNKDELFQYVQFNCNDPIATDTFNIGDEVNFREDISKTSWTIAKFTLSAQQIPCAILENNDGCFKAKLTDIDFLKE